MTSDADEREYRQDLQAARMAELEAEVIRQAEALRFVGSKRHLQQLQQEVAALTAENAELKAQNAALTAENSDQDERTEELRQAREEISALRATEERLHSGIVMAGIEIAELKAQVETLRTALEFYADKENWRIWSKHLNSIAETDDGDVAHEALAAVPASPPVPEEEPDTARLDWLEEQRGDWKGWLYVRDAALICAANVADPDNVREVYGTTIREAIDKARGQEKTDANHD